MTPRERANAQQLLASDPAANVFVNASAGSGKTKLLIDRILRLMLAGADPAGILCLTYTKAAATEMAVRLQRQLVSWSAADDATLDGILRGLGSVPSAARRAQARSLLARVLDLPAGMNIGTIHSFCHMILRRFPLEAQISPHFRLAEESEIDQLVEAAHATILVGGAAAPDAARGPDEAAAFSPDGVSPQAGALSPDGIPPQAGAFSPAGIPKASFQRLALALGLPQFRKLLGELVAEFWRLRKISALPAADRQALLRRTAGLAVASEQALLHDAATRPGLIGLIAHAQDAATAGGARTQARAAEMLRWLALPPEQRATPAAWDDWVGIFLGSYGKNLTTDRALRARHPEAAAAFAREREFLAETEALRAALRMVETTDDLLALSVPILFLYAQVKEKFGLVDYSDLIFHGISLLRDTDSAWILYKLDGGISHLLIDEAQDTSPAQWYLSEIISEEFFAGSGAAPNDRTIFAVGDRKQSIYSFQGADVAAFDRALAQMRDRVRAADAPWREVALDVSFRSTQAVLAVVDAVFADRRAAAGVTAPGETLSHVADRAGQPGEVVLWPLAPPPPAGDVAGPEPNETNARAPGAREQLVKGLAAWVAEELRAAPFMPSRNRPLAAGDILILLKERSGLAQPLMAALKASGVAVAALDRLVLTDQPVVQDLLTLCDVLLLPDDDLALACVLRSPFIGIEEDSLMRLAARRGGRSLWQALRHRAAEEEGWAGAVAFLGALLRQVDYLAPYELLSEILGPQGGRALLFARLGTDAAEPVDELLRAALLFEAKEPPSLQGFLAWVRRSGGAVSRPFDPNADAVRIMTVHGAKGLQAPLVILADATRPPTRRDSFLWARDAQSAQEVPLWAPARATHNLHVEALEQKREDAATEEYNRLLYVALTRAEDRLVICGWQPRGTLPEGSWYRLVERALLGLGAQAEAFTPWAGRALRFTGPASAAALPVPAETIPPPAIAALPDWAGNAPGWRATPLAPPILPPGFVFAQRVELADESPLDGAPAAVLPAALLADPDMAALFGPDSRAEVPITGMVDGKLVCDVIPRLVMASGWLLAGHIASGAMPEGAAPVPAGLARRLDGWRDILATLYPGRRIVVAVIWISGPAFYILPHTLPLARAAAPARAGADDFESEGDDG